MDNLKGQTAAFATFSCFKNWLERAFERLVLWGAYTQTKSVRKLALLHTAQFCRVHPTHLKQAGIVPTGSLESGALLFMSTYNGDGDEYFRIFGEKVPGPMNAIWSRCVGWAGARPHSNLSHFIKLNRRATGTFYSAYPDTVPRIRESLTLRRDLDRLHALAFADTTDEVTFAHEFHELAMRYWGKGSTSESKHAY